MPSILKWRQFSRFFLFVERLKLRHFQPWELLVSVTRRGNRPPPIRLWHNVVPTIVVLDELRHQLGAPITISSGYRTPRYNRGVGGASRSQHQAFTALDFHVRGVVPTTAAAVLKSWRDTRSRFDVPLELKRHAEVVPAGSVPFDALDLRRENGDWSFVFRGGIGIYSTFVHLDTRGQNRTWTRI